jgi:hypothetical protein
LFEHMAQGKPDGRMSITVPRQREKKEKPSKPGRPGLPARTAEVEVRFREVTICAPKTPLLRDKKPITLYAVYLFEKNPPHGATRIQWLLLTTLGPFGEAGDEVRSVVLPAVAYRRMASGFEKRMRGAEAPESLRRISGPGD